MITPVSTPALPLSRHREPTDLAASLAKYTEAQNVMVDQAPAAFLFDTKVAIIVPNNITGFQYNLNYPDVRFWFYDLRPVQ